MKKYFIYTIAQLFAGCLMAQGFTETPIFDNEDLHVVLQCNDTASTDQSDWIRLIIKNKTASPIIISEAEYSINEKVSQPDGSTYIDHAHYGSANKYDLLHYYYDFTPIDDNRKNLELLPYESLSSWKYMANYATVLIEPRLGEKPARICPLFQFKLTYKRNEISKTIENKGAPFCFIWKPDIQISEAKLVQRLRNVLTEAHFRWANTYIIHHLMGKPAIVSQISSDEFVNAVVLRKQSMVNDEAILFLNELRKRNAMPDSRLTERYRTDLQNPINRYLEELVFYWDNGLLDDLLNRVDNAQKIYRILEANAKQWSLAPENRAKVYDYLSQKLFFNAALPTTETFADWSNTVKLLSISRDKRIIDYLAPLLENETEFPVEDHSKYSHSGIKPRDAKPDTLMVRVCDVAFVSLLRAIGQTDYIIDAKIGTKYFGMVFKQGILDKESGHPDAFMVNQIDFGLYLAEKSIKMTDESKAKMMDYIQSLK